MCSIMGFLSELYSAEEIRPYFDRTKSRGPDDTRIEAVGTGLLCFHRLSIMGLDERGMQPFSRGKSKLVCNGELYGWRAERRKLEAKGYSFAGDSAIPTVSCCCRCMRNTGSACLISWTRNLL